MVHPEASTSERKVTSRYWAGGTSPTTLRGKSVPALGNKRAAPECDDSTGLAAEHLRRKHAKTFDFKPAHDEVEVKDEPPSTQPPSDPPSPPSEQPQLSVPQSITDCSSVPTEPLPPTVATAIPAGRPSSSTVPVKSHLSLPSFKSALSAVPAKAPSPTAATRPVCKSSDFKASAQGQKPLPKSRSLREEETVIATLTHICDQSVTEATTNLVLRWGREAPNTSGDIDDLGITYLEGILSRIDEHGIGPERRAVVVDLLVSKLIRHLEALRSRIGTLSAPQLPLSPPSSVDRLVQSNGDAHENDHQIKTLAPLSMASQASHGYIVQNGLRHRLEQQMTGADDTDTDQDTQAAPAKSPASTATVGTSKKLI